MITKFDPIPMTAAEDLLSKLGDSKFFSTLDLSKGFWQIPMRDEDIGKTAFVTPDGHYEFIRMPFDLMNASATLVKCLKDILVGIENVSTYTDDIIIHTKTWESHLETLNQVLTRINDANMTVKPSKCTFGETIMEFIGHMIEDGTIKPNTDKLEKIQSARSPASKKQAQSFLGLIGYYRDYVPQYSHIAAPLTEITKKGYRNKIKWNDSLQNSFESLKNLLIKQPILRLPNFDQEFTLRTDASVLALEAVLLQEHNGTLFPISYASRKLLERERSYGISEKECLSIVWGIKKFQKYLYNLPFFLQTDHRCLKYLEESKFSNQRLMRWALALQCYQFEIEAIKGSKNIGADYMSQLSE